MTASDTDAAIKDQSALHAFVERATGRLSGVRNGILIFDQDRRSDGDIEISLRNLQLLRRDANENDHAELVALTDQCEVALLSLLEPDPTPTQIGRALDLVARIEECLLRIPLGADDFLPDISDFIESSFQSLGVQSPLPEPLPVIEEFEIDEETLEIFRIEASELLANIAANLQRLSASADDRESIWEIRRNAHTFKGAAGIVGLHAASELAHRVEDLLDKVVESGAPVHGESLALLSAAAERLEAITVVGADAGPSSTMDADFDRVIAAIPVRRTVSESSTPPVADPEPNVENVPQIRPAPTPIVRVSLGRLDELIKLSRSLGVNHAALFQRFIGYVEQSSDVAEDTNAEKFYSLLDTQRKLADEICERLHRIRMVRFGTLETRLSRTVNVTCQEDGKKAVLTLENADCEVDTQVIDALIEPLLHLLKNAVVHGIEPPETRRLIGKPERGDIRLNIDTDEFGVTLKVQDDGRGISASRLKQKAVAAGLLTPDFAENMGESDAFGLIFHKGLTTADKIDLNAGRGIGMSIVKESVESCGGSINVNSEAQVGSTFTVRMPLVIRRTEQRAAVAEPAPVVRPVDPEPEPRLILIVDDSASIRRQTSRVVEAAGHRVITAVNGAEAIELLLSGTWSPDVILSDVEMPDMDGWEFLACLKESETLCEIPVIMVTSLASDEYRTRAYELGAANYRVKPVNGPDLVDAINKAFFVNAD